VTFRDRNDKRVFMQKFEELVPDERICADAHLVYVLADLATLVSDVFSNVIFRAYRGAYDAKAVDLDYV